jgi:hypothetical protein
MRRTSRKTGGGGEGVKDVEEETNVAEGGDDVTVDAK